MTANTIRSKLQTVVSAAVAVLVFLGVALVLAWLAGSFHPKVTNSDQHPSAPVEGALWVEVIMLKQPKFESATGTIRPVHETIVSSKLLARVVEVNVKAGQTVRQKEVLVKLDDADLRSRVKQAEAALGSVRAQKQQAEIDFDRVRQLVERNAASKAEYDQARSTLNRLNATFQQAEHAVSETNVVLGYAQIVSPISGVVVDKQVEVGDMVTPGKALLTLYDPTQMQMIAPVRESLALQLAVGQRLPAKVESLGYACEAIVSEIVPEADISSRSFLVKVTGPCPPGILSGMFGRIFIPVKEEQVLLIPTSAIKQIGQLSLVNVVTTSGTQRRAVLVGRSFGDQSEILSGLRVGERLLSSHSASPKGAH